MEQLSDIKKNKFVLTQIKGVFKVQSHWNELCKLCLQLVIRKREIKLFVWKTVKIQYVAT